jgi:CRISPR-associated endonuclease/helicase Cas3
MDPTALRQALALWAKLRSEKEPPPDYHPLLCHLLDVGAVALALWRDVLSEAARRSLAGQLGLAPNDAGVWITFLTALHDLGKASPAFQGQVEAQRVRLGAAGIAVSAGVPQMPHGAVSALALRGLLRTEFGLDQQLAHRTAVVVGGHHGVFPRQADLRPPKADAESWGVGPWMDRRQVLMSAVAELLGLPRDRVPTALGDAATMTIAGFVTVADWIGSNRTYFDYADASAWADPVAGLRDYWGQVQESARTALGSLGWLARPASKEPKSFEALFSRIKEPNALQRRVADLAEEVDSPALVLVEAPMGEGKTEAALYLADRWATRQGASGLYVALPTQATSNQMLDRVGDFLAERYPTAMIGLQLAHGAAELSPAAMKMRARWARLSALCERRGYDQAPAGVVAAEWFAGRKRRLLAPFGVGTVDQSLMAVLQTRHMFVRLFALAHKTVVVDEVHAYDAYMSTLLDQLLEWLAALGSPVVLLSATLPPTRRRELLEAYRRGLGTGAAALPETRYPRISWVSAQDSDACYVDASVRSQKTLRVRWVGDDADALGEQLRAALAQGGCAAVICNTVRRARRVYGALRRHLAEDELMLLHSGFQFGVRDGIEKESLIRFGHPEAKVQTEGGPQPTRRPHRTVLVATQVIEQSLDLDFDLMVSDLAPIDLLLQRVGRLHRHGHGRPAGLGVPSLWIVGPAPDDSSPAFDAGSKAVYGEHLLLRSWLTLRTRARVAIPDEVESLVTEVYEARQEPADSALAARWRESLQALEQQRSDYRSKARNFEIAAPGAPVGVLERFNRDLSEEEEPGVHESLQAVTRLAKPSISVVLVPEAEAEALRRGPTPGPGEARRLLRAAVSLTHRDIVRRLLDTPAPSSWTNSALLRHHRLLGLDASNSAPCGRNMIRVDEKLGVLVDEDAEEID